MKNKNKSVSIVIPCLDQVKAFASHSPELAQISDDLNVIDSTFQHILKSASHVKVILVVGPRKADIAEYVSKKYAKKVDLKIISQKSDVTDTLKAIKSAESVLEERNVVLLPQLIIDSEEKSLIDQMCEMLDDQSFVLAYKAEKSVTRIRLYDAVQVQDNKVMKFKSKPSDSKNFNGVSVCFGFHKSVLGKLLTSTLAEKTSAVQIKNFYDISSWTQYNAYLLKRYLEKSGIDSELLNH